jgi:hypothetical protein
MRLNCLRVPTAAALLISLVPGFAAPIAVPDLYVTSEDAAINVPAPGIIGNDDPNGSTAALSAVPVTQPSHGTLALAGDGTFTYTPAPNFSGADSFTYKIVEGQGPVTFTVDQANSVLTINAQTSVSATGVTDNKTTTAQAKGTVTSLLTPAQSPFGTARIQTLDLALAQQVSLTMCVAKFFGACVGSLTARIDADGLVISMREDQAGPAVPVTAGVFNQSGNSINAVGTMYLTGSGIAGIIEVPPQADLNTTTAYDFNNVTITQNGSVLNLAVPIDITQNIVEADYTATVRISGTVRATAPVPPAGAESNVETVTIDVISVDDSPTAADDRYYTRQNYAISIPANAALPVNETLIAANSVWKYNTGTDLGTGWRTVDFNDSTWPTATGVLGYGETDILASGIIPSGPSGNFHPTAYFRKEFTLAAVGATQEARIEFQRDDACIIWVNGTEVYRDSTPYTTGGTAPLNPTGEITYATFAAATITPDSDGAAYKTVTIPNTVLREGKNVVAAVVKQQSATSSDLRWDLKCSRTSQPTQTLVASGSTWKYRTGTDLGTAWRAAEYNDTAWASGPALLGYGDPDIITSIPVSDPGGQKYPTAYFRTSFSLTDSHNTIQPRVEVQRDDACAIYVNGVEIYRDSTPYTTGGTTPLPPSGDIPYGTYAGASNPDEAGYKTVSFSRSLLREGVNVIAVEVHQNGNASTDLRFDLRAFRTTGVGGVTANDTDIDGPAWAVQLHSPPANGTVTLNTDGSFTYLPNPGFPASGASGTDTFVYRHTSGGQPFASESVVVPFKSTWKYLANGTAAPQDNDISAADWRHPSFDDAAWATGTGEFGYGDGGEDTVIEDDATPGSPTAGSTTRYITTYFRRKFTYSSSTALLSRLKARVVRDDGVAIYLNGNRIVSDNLPSSWNHLTVANTSIGGSDESTPIEVLNIPAAYLVQGENILAAEIHQAAADSSDVSFDCELTAESITGAQVEIIVLNDDLDGDNMSDTWERANGTNPNLADADLDLDGDGQSNRAEFLAATHPAVFSSRLMTTGISAPAANQLQLSFASVPGRTYQLQETTAGLGGWTDFSNTFPAHASAAETAVQFTRPADSQRFYRVRVVNDWQ